MSDFQMGLIVFGGCIAVAVFGVVAVYAISQGHTPTIKTPLGGVDTSPKPKKRKPKGGEGESAK